MSKIYLLIRLLALLKFAQSIYHCETSYKIVHGYGCEISEDIIDVRSESDRVIELSKGNKTVISWIQIYLTQIVSDPRFIFSQFENLDRIFIADSTGLKQLDEQFLDQRVSVVVIRNTDLEVITDYTFKGMPNVTTLSLNFNEISELELHPFDDLVKLEILELTNNKIESLDDDIFQYNVNLVKIALNHNRLKVITARLFSRNPKLTSLSMQSNEINQIEENFNENLPLVRVLDLAWNKCVNAYLVNPNSNVSKAFMANCFTNYKIFEETNSKIKSIQNAASAVEWKVEAALNELDNNLAKIETKIKNATSQESLKANILNFFKLDTENLRANWASKLRNISLKLRSDTINDMEEMIASQSDEIQRKQQKIRVEGSFRMLRDEFNRKINLIYWLDVVIVCLLVIVIVVISKLYK